MKFEYAGMPPDSSAPELAHARITRVAHERFLGLGPTGPFPRPMVTGSARLSGGRNLGLRHLTGGSIQGNCLPPELAHV